MQDITLRVNKLSNRLIEEIKTQRELMAAENNELEVHPGPLNSIAFLRELVESNEILQIAQDKKIIIDSHTKDREIITDEVLL